MKKLITAILIIAAFGLVTLGQAEEHNNKHLEYKIKG